MCLYERRIRNAKFEPNISNKGNVPKCNDYRQLTVKIGCGWCEECRKQLANSWRVRIFEEMKDDDKAEGVTLTFSPESISELETEMYIKGYKGLESDEGALETDVNLLASYAIRMFTERWRKKFKKAPKHWFITELGQESSERLHIHGLIWNTTRLDKEEFQKEIHEKWRYGNVDFLDYVSERTVEYYIKYVQKLDEHHKGYKQKIFTSKGIGLAYVKKAAVTHAFRGENTIQSYRTATGNKIALPRYYRSKLWTDEEREKLWSMALDKEEIYIAGQKHLSTEDAKQFDRALEGARESNTLAGYGDNNTKGYKYIITEAMKCKKDELINLDKTKLVKRVPRRKIEKIIAWKESEVLDKSRKLDNTIYGEYEGNLTESERKSNKQMQEAKILGCTVKQLRLIEAGICNVGQLEKRKWFENEADRIKYILTLKKYRGIEK